MRERGMGPERALKLRSRYVRLEELGDWVKREEGMEPEKLLLERSR